MSARGGVRRRVRSSASLAAAFVLATTGFAARGDAGSRNADRVDAGPGAGHVETVEAFVAAFNAQDADAMASLVTDDVEWLSIDGARVVVETGSREALVASMQRYFASCPSCRSRLESPIATATRVAVVEIATWRARDGERTQRGLAVYEFADDRIRRVHYFPAER